MIQPIRIARTGWWRFSEYRTYRGFIVPAERASFEPYDPWADYENSKRLSKGQPPYQDLFDLLVQVLPEKVASMMNATCRLIKGHFDAPPHLKATFAKFSTSEVSHATGPILSWCKEHGLLGILPLSATEITLMPRWGVSNTEPRYMTPIADQFRREHGGWHKTGIGGGEFSFASEKAATRAIELVDAGTFPIGVRTRPIGRMRQQVELKTEEIHGQYFPRLPWRDRKQRNVPFPLSRRFWKYYGESLTEFLRHALFLLACVLELDQDRRHFKRFVKLCSGNESDAFSINDLTSRCERRLFLARDGRTEFRWQFPGLLGIYGEMAVQDSVSGTRFLYCEECNRPFTTTAYQAKYCSNACAWRDRKRKARQR